MERVRSPNYPSISLPKAIELVGKIHSANRTNPVDREAVVKDMGYSALSGRSAKVLATLLQFALLERAGKGGVRVTRDAVDILHPVNDAEKRKALEHVGLAPALFTQLRDRFPDGSPSENAIRSYLMRQDFADVAVGPAVNSFLETYRFLQQEGVFDSHGVSVASASESGGDDGYEIEDAAPVALRLPAPSPARAMEGVRIMDGERIVFSEEIDGTQYLKLVANGEMNADLLEALEDFIKRQRKRLIANAQF